MSTPVHTPRLPQIASCSSPVHILTIGSNLQPHINIPKALDALLDLSLGPMWVSTIGRTSAEGLLDHNAPAFLNFAIACPFDLPAASLKERLNAIEISLGRDRSDPLSSVKNRPVDIDPTFILDPRKPTAPHHLLPHEPYLLPFVLELLRVLGLRNVPLPVHAYPSVGLSFSHQPIGLVPVCITRTADYASTHVQPL